MADAAAAGADTAFVPLQPRPGTSTEERAAGGIDTGTAGDEGRPAADAPAADAAEGDPAVAATGPESTAAESEGARDPGPRRPLGDVIAAGAFEGDRSSGPAAVPVDRPRRRLVIADRVDRTVLGVALLVLLAVVSAALIVAVVVKTRNDAAGAAQGAVAGAAPLADPSAAATGSPTASAAPAASGGTATIGDVAVIGDAGAIAAASGVPASQRWTALLDDAVAGDVAADASAGAGYTTAGAGDATFVQWASSVPADTDAAVFVGGSADAEVPALVLAKAATTAYSRVAQRAPGVRLVVVAPLTADGASAAQLQRVRSALRAAARIADAEYVDPVAAGWVRSGAARSSALTSADERVIAARLKALLGSR